MLVPADGLASHLRARLVHTYKSQMRPRWFFVTIVLQPRDKNRVRLDNVTRGFPTKYIHNMLGHQKFVSATLGKSHVSGRFEQ